MLTKRNRLHRLEDRLLPKAFKPALTFLWGSHEQDAELEALEARARAEDKELIVIRLVPLEGPSDHVTA
jgi:hypothetical protein